MDKNGLLIQVIAMRGKYPDRKVLVWSESHGPWCNECGETGLFTEKFQVREGYPLLTLLGDKHHNRELDFVCINCGTKLKDHP